VVVVAATGTGFDAVPVTTQPAFAFEIQ
jgi:hypothetical protein